MYRWVFLPGDPGCWALARIHDNLAYDIQARAWRAPSGAWRWQTHAPFAFSGVRPSAELAMEAAEKLWRSRDDLSPSS